MGTGTPVVLVLLDGRAATINYAAANVPAILHAWFPGEFAGRQWLRLCLEITIRVEDWL